MTSSCSSGTGDFLTPLGEIFNDIFCLFGSCSASPLTFGGEMLMCVPFAWEMDDGEGRMTLSGVGAGAGDGEERRFRLLGVEVVSTEEYA